MLTHAKMRDRIAARTHYRRDIVAHILDEVEYEIARELQQQGEVVIRGVLRVTPIVRVFDANGPVRQRAGLLRTDPGPRLIKRVILRVKPVRAFRKLLSQLPLPTPKKGDDPCPTTDSTSTP